MQKISMCILGDCNVFPAAALARAVGTAWSTVASCVLPVPLLGMATVTFVAKAKKTFPLFIQMHTLLTGMAASCLKSKGIEEMLEWINRNRDV